MLSDAVRGRVQCSSSNKVRVSDAVYSTHPPLPAHHITGPGDASTNAQEAANDTFAAGTLFETYGKGKNHITRADFESMLRSDVSTAVERSGFKGAGMDKTMMGREQQPQTQQLALQQQQQGSLPSGATSNSTLAHMHALATEIDALEGELIALSRVPGNLRFGARGIAHAHAMRVIENQIQVGPPLAWNSKFHCRARGRAKRPTRGAALDFFLLADLPPPPPRLPNAGPRRRDGLSPLGSKATSNPRGVETESSSGRGSKPVAESRAVLGRRV